MLKGDAAFIPAIAEHICKEFINDGYDGHRHHLENGSIDISLAKGDFFKSVLGMDTALKIRIEPSDEGISFDAGIGVFGKEKLPTVLSMFFAWPVILTHLWGLVKQSQLDDKALSIAESVLKANTKLPINIIYYTGITE